MTASEDINNGLGGGYIYQWNLSILISLSYLFFPVEPLVDASLLNGLTNEFLGDIQSIHLEGREKDDDGDNGDGNDKGQFVYEDINILAKNRSIFIQVKKRKPGNPWTLGDPTLLKAFFNFYKNHALDIDEPLAKFVFISDRDFNEDLHNLKCALENFDPDKTIIKQFLSNFIRFYKKREENVCFEEVRFYRLLKNVYLIPSFSSNDRLEADINTILLKKRLEPNEVKNAQAALFKEFSDKSTLKQGFSIDENYICEIVPQLQPNLRNYIKTSQRRNFINAIEPLFGNVEFGYFIQDPNSVINKVDLLLRNSPVCLNETEAFILLISALLIFIEDKEQASFDLFSDFFMKAFSFSPEEYKIKTFETIFKEVASDIKNVVRFNPYDGFPEGETRIRNELVRSELIAVILYWARLIALDKQVDPSMPDFIRDSNIEEHLNWWKQAYVRSVEKDKRGYIVISFRFPKENLEDYKRIIANPLIKKIERLRKAYESLLEEAGLQIKGVVAKTENSSEDFAPSIPLEDWRVLKENVESEEALIEKDGLSRDIIYKQHLREIRAKDEIDQAENFASSGNNLRAAQGYEAAANIISESSEWVQTALYQSKSAEAYSKVEEINLAITNYLSAAESWLKGVTFLVEAKKCLEDATRLIEKINNNKTDFQIKCFFIEVKISFAEGCDEKCEKILKEIFRLLTPLDLNTNYEIVKNYAILNSIYSLCWDKHDEAIYILKEALRNSSMPLVFKIELWTRLLVMYIKQGDNEKIDEIYQEASSEFPSSFNSIESIGLLTLQYAASLSRRGNIENAIISFEKALKNLEDAEAKSYILAFAYQLRRYMLVRNSGGSVYLPFEHEAKVIDAFKANRKENLGYENSLKAKLALCEGNLEESLRYSRLALVSYWEVGDWYGIEEVNNVTSNLYGNLDRVPEALYCAIKASDSKQAEKHCERIRNDISSRTMLFNIITNLLKKQPARNYELIAVKSLGELGDVIEPSLIESVLNYLLQALKREEKNYLDFSISRAVITSLRKLIIQFDEMGTRKIINNIMEYLKDRNPHRSEVNECLKLIRDFFTIRSCKVSSDLYPEILDFALEFNKIEILDSEINDIVLNLARTAPVSLRELLVKYANEQKNILDKLTYYVVLNEPIEEEELVKVLSGILKGLNYKPRTEGGMTIYGISFSNCQRISTFKEIIPVSFREILINELLNGIQNRYISFHDKGQAILTLSELPNDILAPQVKKIIEILFASIRGDYPSSKGMEWGSLEYVREYSLYMLGKLYILTENELQEKISNCLINWSRYKNPLVRQGVAEAFMVIDSNEKKLPSRLLLALMVLLNDQDVEVCVAACRAAGHILVTNLAFPFEEDFLEQLFSLAQDERSRQERISIVGTLRALKNKGGFGEKEDRISKLLNNFSDNDPSAEVRYYASQ